MALVGPNATEAISTGLGSAHRALTIAVLGEALAAALTASPAAPLASPCSATSAGRPSPSGVFREHLLERERDALPARIQNTASNRLPHREQLACVPDIAIGNFTDVNHPVLRQTEIDECSEARDIEDEALDDLILLKGSGIRLCEKQSRDMVAHARVPTGVGNLTHQVAPGRLFDVEVHAAKPFRGAAFAEQFLHRSPAGFRQLSNETVLIGVKAGHVESLGPPAHSQECDRARPLCLAQESVGPQLFAIANRFASRDTRRSSPRGHDRCRGCV